MEIRLATEADKTRWDDFALGHEQGLAYHRFGWLEAITSAYGFKVYPLLAEKGGQIHGLLPLVHIRFPLMRGALVSLPYCDLGGTLADCGDTATVLKNRAKALAAELAISRVEIRSAVPLEAGALPHPQKVRMVLQLPGSSEALFAGFKAKLRSQVRKPERDGLRAVLGGGELLDDFYRVFAENMRDLGSPVHSRAWFAALDKGLGDALRVGVVYMPDGSPAAAGIILCHGRRVSIPWASSLRRYNPSNPNMLLYWTFLAFSADNGYAQFDFGRSTPEEGTFRFKQQWGSSPQPLYWQDIGQKGLPGPSGKEGKSPVRESVEGVWRRLPLGVCNLLGPQVRRFVSL